MVYVVAIETFFVDADLQIDPRFLYFNNWDLFICPLFLTFVVRIRNT